MLASGALISDPLRRDGAKGPFTTATICATGDEPVLISIIGFGVEAERLLEYSKGDALAVSGRARLTSWVAHDGTEKRGISVVAEQIAALKPKRYPMGGPRPRPASGRALSRHTSVPPSRSRPLPDDRVDDLWQGGVP